MTIPAGSRPFAVSPGEPKAVWFLGQRLEITVSSEQTSGAYAVTNATVEPGFGPGSHIHHREDEAVYVIDGELEFTIDGECLQAPAGTLVHIPKGSVHAWTNVGATPSRQLTIYTPAGFEGIFHALGEPIEDGTTASSTLLDGHTLRERGREWGLEVPDLHEPATRA